MQSIGPFGGEFYYQTFVRNGWVQVLRCYPEGGDHWLGEVRTDEEANRLAKADATRHPKAYA